MGGPRRYSRLVMALSCQLSYTATSAAALAVSLIAMVGMGGRGFRDRHREATLATLLALPLDRKDLVYLSPFVEEPGSTYADRRAADGLAPMSPAEIEEETGRYAAALRGRGLRVGRYDI